jgi:hypothetical protein
MCAPVMRDVLRMLLPSTRAERICDCLSKLSVFTLLLPSA